MGVVPEDVIKFTRVFEMFSSSRQDLLQAGGLVYLRSLATLTCLLVEAEAAVAARHEGRVCTDNRHAAR